MSDDFENLDQVILPEVARDAAKCGLTIERPEVASALASLLSDGLIKAYDLSVRTTDPFRTELPGMPPLDEIEGITEMFKTYFYPTKKGMDLHLYGEKWWPFDDCGQLRSDWRLDPDPQPPIVNLSSA